MDNKDSVNLREKTLAIHQQFTKSTNDFCYTLAMYCIRGLFGCAFNLAVWQIFIGLPNLNHAVLTRTHEMN